MGTSAAPSAAATSASTSVKDTRSPLGAGLGRLVAAEKPGARSSLAASVIRPEGTAIRDDQGRVLVDLTPQQGVDRAAYRQAAEAAGLEVTATDDQHGTLEGFVPVAAVTQLAALKGTGTLAQAAGAHTDAGSVQSQGVAFQKVDQVLARGIDGRGVTVGALSDSYNQATTDVFGAPLTIHEAQDVASGDLPGPGNKVNQNPVKVLQDSPDGLDEGRAMLQIVHDVAPRADLCFATANGGELNFAANIRALAAKNGPCKADVVVDDVSYFAEPFFSDGVIADAVDDVTAKGVSYFSSAGNGGEHQAWRQPVRLVPADAASLGGTNLDFSDVDPALYDGGLQDADPGPGVDPARSYSLEAAGGIFDLQWDDPFDPDGPTLADPYLDETGEIAAPGDTETYTFTATQAQVGQDILVTADGVPSGSTDLVLTVEGPDGSVVGPVDTGTSPEIAATTITQAGDYTITVAGYEDSTGPFTLTVAQVLQPSKTTTDFNALLFTDDGQYVGALSDANRISGRPIELSSLGGIDELQIVIAKSGTEPSSATTLAVNLFDGIYVDEYYDPTAPATFGHHTAAGTIGVAAYDPFKPFLPESFTSPGSKSLPIRFDSNGDPYKKVQKRTAPYIASTDRGNTTFFTSDTPQDADTLPNFAGTSAAAPHAAGIAALVLDSRGRTSPAKMRDILGKATFKHDLDPFTSGGQAGKLTVRADGDQGDERSPYVGPGRDPNFFTVANSGKSAVSSITFFGATASPTALGNGIVFDPRPNTGVPPFRQQGFPFTVGRTSGGIAPASVSATFAGAGGAQTAPGQFKNMTVRFDRGLQKGQSVSFGVDRDLAVSGYGYATEGNGADELGGAVSIPDGAVLKDGMQFRVVFADGSVKEGVFRNDLGRGYSVVDGYGLVDAAAAALR
ncbi:S8 family serine peptidase [Nocardioides anomalus]|uniref:S8 family serine peptidase n=1 Tax=Nocardioides anomalus TaxID=2712223 RepID=UPI001E2B06E3|nr:S8 family serine peptidase [Nocardioides anomalus]